MSRLRPSALLLALAALGLPGTGQAAPRVTRLGDSTVPVTADAASGTRIDRVYFGSDGALRWDASPATPAADACPGTLVWRRTARREPRVDEYLCRRADRPRAERVTIGLTPAGQTAWKRRLVFPSGKLSIDLSLLGATAHGLVLSNLEVVSPATGETLVPARTHAVAGEARTVPDLSYSGAAAYLPKTGDLLVFDAEVSLVRRSGGVYRIDPRSGARRLVHPVASDLLGRYDRVEAIAPTSDGRFALFAQRQSTRGQSSVSVVVFDLAEERAVFEQTHGAGFVCSDPQVEAGTGGAFAFAYRDDSASRRVLVHYRIEP